MAQSRRLTSEKPFSGLSGTGFFAGAVASQRYLDLLYPLLTVAAASFATDIGILAGWLKPFGRKATKATLRR